MDLIQIRILSNSSKKIPNLDSDFSQDSEAIAVMKLIRGLDPITWKRKSLNCASCSYFTAKSMSAEHVGTWRKAIEELRFWMHTSSLTHSKKPQTLSEWEFELRTNTVLPEECTQKLEFDAHSCGIRMVG